MEHVTEIGKALGGMLGQFIFDQLFGEKYGEMTAGVSEPTSDFRPGDLTTMIRR